MSVRGAYITTEVAPVAGDDLAGSCIYDLLISETNLRQNGVLVIFERGDSASLFGDAELRQLASTLHFSLLSAHECHAASYHDFQSDPAKGPGRALFQALTQLAEKTGHPELASANVLLYGFSAAGALAAEMASFAPSRVMGIIAYAPGSGYQNLADLRPTAAALAVPSLFLANAKDGQAGTLRSETYFINGRIQGAVWAYAVQPGRGHCCNISTRSMILPWIAAVVPLRGGGAGSLNPVSQSEGVVGSFVCSPDGVVDAQGDEDCGFTSAALAPPSTLQQQSVWLPGLIPAQEWLAWVATARQ